MYLTNCIWIWIYTVALLTKRILFAVYCIRNIHFIWFSGRAVVVKPLNEKAVPRGSCAQTRQITINKRATFKFMQLLGNKIVFTELKSLQSGQSINSFHKCKFHYKTIMSSRAKPLMNSNRIRITTFGNN